MKAYINRLQETLHQVEITDRLSQKKELFAGLEELMSIFKKAKAGRKRVFFIGNGGSTAIAQHMTVDFLKNGGLRTQSLCEASTLTCLGNDFGYEQIFARQVRAAAEPGDLLVAISSSGNSGNIVLAIETARQKACGVLTLSGFEPENALRKLGDLNIYVPLSEYGIVESIHNLILQMIVDLILEEDGVGMQ